MCEGRAVKNGPPTPSVDITYAFKKYKVVFKGSSCFCVFVCVGLFLCVRL